MLRSNTDQPDAHRAARGSRRVSRAARLSGTTNQKGQHMLRGSCACGRVRYEIRGNLLGPVTYCHCWRCRKHSGSSFGTTAGVAASDFVVVAGEELLSDWESSHGVRRYFASCCGSPIFKRDEADPTFLGFRLGTLDSDPHVSVEVHFMVGSKAPWVDIRDSLPQDAQGVPFGERD
ncbi:MAG: GFA family protein [Metallibacterium sp.]